jgi:hypothetical protein
MCQLVRPDIHSARPNRQRKFDRKSFTKRLTRLIRKNKQRCHDDRVVPNDSTPSVIHRLMPEALRQNNRKVFEKPNESKVDAREMR